MKTNQKTATVLMIVLVLTIHAQDSTITKPARPERPHELGISVLTPMIVLAGGSVNSWDNFTNLTYRYRVTEKRAFKLFIGAGRKNSYYPDPLFTGQIVPTTNPAYYLIRNDTRPSNFQVGIGYEYMFGKRLKHVLGTDIVYSNSFEKTEYYHVKIQESTQSGVTTTNYTRLDTGSYATAMNYDKMGLNLAYSLRYELSRRWAVTGTFIAALRYSRSRQDGGYVESFELNITPIGDISAFYKF
jgi:hypothetical protein